jgi:threonine/homoserine efflux transporter RhtA
MIKQFTSKSSAPSPAYAAVNVAIWVIYVALVLLATQVLGFHSTVAVAASVLAAAVVFYPLHRRAQRAAKRRFDHRLPGHDRRSRYSNTYADQVGRAISVPSPG